MRICLSLVALGLSVASCSALGGSAQCRVDGDCADFGVAVCAEDGVCVSRPAMPPAAAPPGSGPVTSEGTSTPLPPDASTPPVPVEAGAPDPCLATNKPRVPVAGRSPQAGILEITTNTTLRCTEDHVLVGDVVVLPGVTLTVEAGTTILGDVVTRGSLTVRAGGRLVAAGTAQKPIVFTSSQPPSQRAPSDWGGLAVLGLAPPTGTLPHLALPWGGTDAEHDAGVLRYVRVEYAARGLELGGVGRGTAVDFVQVRKAGDNCLRLRGGTVRAKHLLCQYPGDEMVEISEGYDGELQYLVGQRTPIRDRERNGLLIEGARAVVTNATFCGSDVTNDSFAFVARSGASLSLTNAIALGFGAGLDVQGAPASLEVRGVTFHRLHAGVLAHAESAAVTDPASLRYDDDRGFDEVAFLGAAARANTLADPGLASCLDPDAPSFAPAATLPGLTLPASVFLDGAATFRGAATAGDGWATAPWTVWSAR